MTFEQHQNYLVARLHIFSASTLPYSEELLLKNVKSIEKTKLCKSYFPLQINLIKWGKLLSNKNPPLTDSKLGTVQINLIQGNFANTLF